MLKYEGKMRENGEELKRVIHSFYLLEDRYIRPVHYIIMSWFSDCIIATVKGEKSLIS